MACLVLSGLLFFFQQDTKKLLHGGIEADMVKRLNYSDPETSSANMGTPSWYWKAIQSDPVKWLGPNNIPRTPEYESHYRVSKAIFEKVMKKHDKRKKVNKYAQFRKNQGT